MAVFFFRKLKIRYRSTNNYYVTIERDTTGLYNRSELNSHSNRGAAPIKIKCKNVAMTVKPLIGKEGFWYNIEHIKSGTHLKDGTQNIEANFSQVKFFEKGVVTFYQNILSIKSKKKKTN